jgi:hypothetical protein
MMRKMYLSAIEFGNGHSGKTGDFGRHAVLEPSSPEAVEIVRFLTLVFSKVLSKRANTRFGPKRS